MVFISLSVLSDVPLALDDEHMYYKYTSGEPVFVHRRALLEGEDHQEEEEDQGDKEEAAGPL